MSSPAVNYFRPRRPGPESILEDHLVVNLSGTLSDATDWWLGGSLPLGAGIPDLIAVSREPELERVATFDRAAIEVLAYLRAVRTARADSGRRISQIKKGSKTRGQ